MARVVRVISPDEAVAFRALNHRAFAHAAAPDDPSTLEGDNDRRFAVYDDNEMVGIGRNYTMQLTMPGGRRIPVGGVSWISVSPTHRRRGVMRDLMRALVDDSRERGELASVLTASEGGIYWGQGYGPATWAMSGVVTNPRAARMATRSEDGGTTRYITGSPSEVGDVVRPIYERACDRAGMLTRPDYVWNAELCYFTDTKTYNAVVAHRGVDGNDDGYVVFEVTGGWGVDRTPQKSVTVHEFVATNPVAHRALWQHLLDLDLVTSVEAQTIPIDDPIRVLLADTRAFATRSVVDRLWIRPLDTIEFLRARTFRCSEPVVVEVTDQDGDVTRVRISADGVEKTDEPAAVSLGGAALGAVSLGGTTVASLIAAGRAEEHRSGAANDLDDLFRNSEAPAMLIGF